MSGAAQAPQATGWLSGVAHCASVNCNARPPGAVISLVVLHSISLPPGCFGTNAIEELFTNRLDWDAHPYYEEIRGIEVSAHFLVRRDGAIVQFVSCAARAWHAGASSWRGRTNCNDHSIGIELEGIEGGAFEDAQYDALQGLLRRLAKAYPIDAVAGHEHIAPGRKFDPGSGFDWPRLIASLGWPAGWFPPSIARAAGDS
jgi:N-acetyl-anhydromuramoyl-L-alanine amidase